MLKIEEFMILKLETVDLIKNASSESEVLKITNNLKEKLNTSINFIKQQAFNFSPNLKGHDVNSIGNLITSSNQVTTRKLDAIKKDPPKHVILEKQTEPFLDSKYNISNTNANEHLYNYKKGLHCKNVRCGNHSLGDKEMHDGYCYDCFKIFKALKK